MKFTFLILFFCASLNSYSQKKEITNFKFNDTMVEYTRLDYSKYGITQFFITMHNDNPEINLIEIKSINCLRNKERIYHTLYFFLKIPKIIKTQAQKERLFSDFVAHLKKVGKKENIDLYLNFDSNYSIPYQLSNNNVKRVITDIYPKKICRALTIR